MVGVTAMRAATVIDAGFRRVRTPDWLRPAIGGLLLGLLAMEFPYVLGSGHGGIEQVLHQNLPLVVLFTLMAAKCLARSEERRVGQGVSTCRSRWSPHH